MSPLGLKKLPGGKRAIRLHTGRSAFLFPALRFLQRPAQLGDAAPRLPFSAKLPPLIGQNAQMDWRLDLQHRKAARKLGTIFRRIGN